MGCLFVGFLADRYGRKMPYIVCNYMLVVLLYFSTKVENYWTFVGLNFLYGVG